MSEKSAFLTRVFSKFRRVARNFFYPEFNLRTVSRMAGGAFFSLVIFGFVLRPCFINGNSMQPRGLGIFCF